MKTSWIDTRQIEDYLEDNLNPLDKLRFEVRLLANPALRRDLYYQKKARLLVKMYHRKKQKEAWEMVHLQLFSNPDNGVFQQSIYRLFK